MTPGYDPLQATMRAWRMRPRRLPLGVATWSRRRRDLQVAGPGGTTGHSARRGADCAAGPECVGSPQPRGSAAITAAPWERLPCTSRARTRPSATCSPTALRRRSPRLHAGEARARSSRRRSASRSRPGQPGSSPGPAAVVKDDGTTSCAVGRRRRPTSCVRGRRAPSSASPEGDVPYHCAAGPHVPRRRRPGAASRSAPGRIPPATVRRARMCTSSAQLFTNAAVGICQ